MINFDQIWDFIQENSDFFKKISKKDEIDILFDERRYIIDGRWRVDPFYMILYVFRQRFIELGPSSEHEFTRMSKMAYSYGVKFPFGKKEYDKYAEFEVKNQNVLYVIEEFLKPNGYKFKIPLKDAADKLFANVSAVIENVLQDIFMYEGHMCRYYVDIYERLSGFEVYLDNGSIFIPARYFDVDRPAFLEDKLTNIDVKDIVTVRNIDDIDTYGESALSPGVIYLSTDSTDSISNATKYFRTFNIDCDDKQFIYSAVHSIKKSADKEVAIVVGDNDIVSFYANEILDLYSSHSSSAIPFMIDIAKSASGFNPVEKDMLLTALYKELQKDIVDIIRPYIEGGDNSDESVISELIDNGNIELCAKKVRLNGDSSSIIFYNKKMKYFKEFTIDKSGITNELIPDLGGFRFISNACGINRDKTIPGFSSVDNYIFSIVSKVIHREFSMLPIFRAKRTSGSHMLGETPVYSSSGMVFGLNGRVSKDGYIVDPNLINSPVPKVKPTKRSVVSSMKTVVDACSGYIVADKKEYESFAIMMMSSILLPFVKRANKFVASISGASEYAKDGIKYRIFNGVFRNARIVKTDYDFVIKTIIDGSTSILVTDNNNEIKKTIWTIARERFGDEQLTRSRSSDIVKTTTNTSPLLIFSDSKMVIEDSIVFDFIPRVSNYAEARLYDYDDEAGNIAHYVIHNTKKISQIEDRFVDKARKYIKEKSIVDKNAYMDFFEKILPAMCLCELTGYMPGIEFHDRMMDTFFRSARLRSNIRIDKMILSVVDGAKKVEDKVFDIDLRNSQAGDMVYVDKAFHRAYIDNDDTDTFVFIFDVYRLYEMIRKNTDMSFVEFYDAIRMYDGYMNAENASKNWRIGSDRKKSVYQAYKEYIGGDRDNFAAIKMSKSNILSIS